MKPEERGSKAQAASFQNSMNSAQVLNKAADTQDEGDCQIDSGRCARHSFARLSIGRFNLTTANRIGSWLRRITQSLLSDRVLPV